MTNKRKMFYSEYLDTGMYNVYYNYFPEKDIVKTQERITKNIYKRVIKLYNKNAPHLHSIFNENEIKDMGINLLYWGAGLSIIGLDKLDCDELQHVEQFIKNK